MTWLARMTRHQSFATRSSCSFLAANVLHPATAARRSAKAVEFLSEIQVMAIGVLPFSRAPPRSILSEAERATPFRAGV